MATAIFPTLAEAPRSFDGKKWIVGLSGMIQSQTSGYVPVRILSPEGGGHEAKGMDWGSHIDWRRERVPARTLGPNGGGSKDPTLVVEANNVQSTRLDMGYSILLLSSGLIDVED
ncbi:hypothetical protein SDJN02_19697 [Cucurbita argyrosperma subsp. argyrosperma]|nr:hypothetical protein SDJN02_19697 [Cucurbita argyrosperma subsp. argyrosperma]